MIQISQSNTQTLSMAEYLKERNSTLTNEGRKVVYNDKNYLILSLENGSELWCSAPLSERILSGENINVLQDCKVLRNITEDKVYDYLVSKGGKIVKFNNLTI